MAPMPQTVSLHSRLLAEPGYKGQSDCQKITVQTIQQILAKRQFPSKISCVSGGRQIKSARPWVQH